MLNRLGMVALVLMTLSGCVTPTTMLNPVTGEMVPCVNRTPATFPLIAQSEINQCVSDYEKAGWTREDNPALARANQEKARKAFADEVAQVRQECLARKTSGEFKTNVEVVQCGNPKVVELFQRRGERNLDLVYLLNAARLAAAEKIDRHEVTEAEAELQIAELRTRIAAEDRRRALETNQANNLSRMADAAMMQADAAQRQAAAANTQTMLMGLSALQPHPAPVSQPVNTTCNRLGNTVNCSTW